MAWNPLGAVATGSGFVPILVVTPSELKPINLIATAQAFELKAKVVAIETETDC